MSSGELSFFFSSFHVMYICKDENKTTFKTVTWIFMFKVEVWEICINSFRTSGTSYIPQPFFFTAKYIMHLSMLVVVIHIYYKYTLMYTQLYLIVNTYNLLRKFKKSTCGIYDLLLVMNGLKYNNSSIYYYSWSFTRRFAFRFV